MQVGWGLSEGEFVSMEKGMCEGSESELPRLDEESTSGSESSEFYTPTMSDPSATNSTPSSSSSAYQSARIESLRASRSAHESPVEFEIAASKSHWTDLDSDEEPDCSPEGNLKYFQSLQLQYQWAFNDPAIFDRRNLVVGKEIAEGGQAEIYEVKVQGNVIRYVVKVFKEGYSLRSLHRQWPPELLAQWKRPGPIPFVHHIFFQIEGAILLNDERFSNRFAFVMRRAWGDLRKLIDLLMLNRKHKRGCPPFSTTEALHHMQRIALDMLNYMSGVSYIEISKLPMCCCGRILLMWEFLRLEGCLILNARWAWWGRGFGEHRKFFNN